MSTPMQGKTRCLRLIDLSVYLLECESLSALTVRLQQQVVRLYIFEYFFIIMVNARWLMRQCIWSGRIGNLHLSMVCSSLLRREGRSQQSSLAFKATWTKKGLHENIADYDRVKVFFTLPLRNFNQSML